MSVIVIAEAGVNHNGDLKLAEELIEIAADSGADYVKFQTFRTERLVAREAAMAAYQRRNSPSERTQFDLLKKLELGREAFIHLKGYARRKDIGFLSSGFDLESVEFLGTLGLDFFKIPSGEITNYPYLVAVAKQGRPVILSTGMADMLEIRQATDALISNGLKKTDITVLHCNTEYPTPFQDVNLKAMVSMGNALGVPYGYSDHTTGIEVPIAAVALGARVIEKHFTISRTMIGPDHAASLELPELKMMVQCIRNIEFAVKGSGVKQPSPSELKNKSIVRRSIFTSRDIEVGTVVQESDLIMLRPGDGISPMELSKVVGRLTTKDLKEGHKLIWHDLQ